MIDTAPTKHQIQPHGRHLSGLYITHAAFMKNITNEMLKSAT
jgi:hypothetical protein